jgi:excinuclease UvrABC nuclease subunit
MATKKTDYNKTGINKLPIDKPAVYKIETEKGKANYVGIAKRGRLQERVQEHLGEVPGAQVRIEQTSSISQAREKEARIIKRSQPKYNKQGK